MYSVQNGKYHEFELSFQLFRVQRFIVGHELTSCRHYFVMPVLDLRFLLGFFPVTDCYVFLC